MEEEKNDLAEKLTFGYHEVKIKLDEAVEKYGDLETKYKEMMLSHEEMIFKKNECISMLKSELDSANLLIKSVKEDSFQKEVESMSPSAAVASKFIKSGMTLTQIYNEYLSVSEQLISSKEEVEKLKEYMTLIVQELEDKSPIILKQQEEFERSRQMIVELTKHNEELISEMQLLRETTNEAKRMEGLSVRENARFKKEVLDLGRQVCHLLKEVEIARNGGSSSTSTDQDMLSDRGSCAELISKNLVTFSDISELQNTNQKLLAVVRELSEKQEEFESVDPTEIAELKTKLDNLREQHAYLLDQQEKQNKMMSLVISQKDMYKNLYEQLIKGGSDDMPVQLERTVSGEGSSQSPKAMEQSDTQPDDRVQELEAHIKDLCKELAQIKEETENFRNEKIANEKILIEQMDKMRSDLQESIRQNAKLISKLESADEMRKVAKNNISVYKNQLEKLEERNKIYNETIVKQETCLKYLRDETLEISTKLARAEVVVENLQKENALLRDSESRLLRERETYKKEAHSQNLLHVNIELIKATLERNDAESKLKLEDQVKDAHRECAALRRRLQEEQDRFRQMTDHLEKQTQNAQIRMEEEREQAEKLRKELEGVREELIDKTIQIEDLTKKLKTSLMSGIDTGVDSKKYREVERMLREREVEIDTLQQKLKIMTEALDQHSNIAEEAEKQLVQVRRFYGIKIHFVQMCW